MTYKEGTEDVFFTQFSLACGKIVLNLFSSKFGQIHSTDFASFSPYTEFTGIQVNG